MSQEKLSDQDKIKEKDNRYRMLATDAFAKGVIAYNINSDQLDKGNNDWLDKSIRLQEIAINFYKKVTLKKAHDYHEMADVHQQRVLCFIAKKTPEKALQDLLAIINCTQQMNTANKTDKVYYLDAFAHFNLASLNTQNEKDYAYIIDHCFLAAKALDAINCSDRENRDFSLFRKIYGLLGQTYLNHGEFKKARVCLFKSLQFSQSIHNADNYEFIGLFNAYASLFQSQPSSQSVLDIAKIGVFCFADEKDPDLKKLQRMFENIDIIFERLETCPVNYGDDMLCEHELLYTLIIQLYHHNRDPKFPNKYLYDLNSMYENKLRYMTIKLTQRLPDLGYSVDSITKKELAKIANETTPESKGRHVKVIPLKVLSKTKEPQASCSSSVPSFSNAHTSSSSSLSRANHSVSAPCVSSTNNSSSASPSSPIAATTITTLFTPPPSKVQEKPIPTYSNSTRWIDFIRQLNMPEISLEYNLIDAICEHQRNTLNKAFDSIIENLSKESSDALPVQEVQDEPDRIVNQPSFIS